MAYAVVGQGVGAEQDAQPLILEGRGHSAEFFVLAGKMGHGRAVGYYHELEPLAGQALDIIGRIFQHQFQNGRLIAVNMQAEIVIHTYSP